MSVEAVIRPDSALSTEGKGEQYAPVNTTLQFVHAMDNMDWHLLNGRAVKLASNAP